MARDIAVATALARAKVKVKREREKLAIEARESALVERLLADLTLPIAKDGKDGRDAPTLSEIVAEILPQLPEPTHTETTVVQEVNPTDMEVFIKGLLPEIDPEDRPAVEQIVNTTIDVSDEKISQATEGMVTKKEFKKALQKIQDAISASQSGGVATPDLANVIVVTETQTITANELLADRYNIILVMTEGITVTLPVDTGTKIIEIKQGFEGTGTYTVCKE